MDGQAEAAHYEMGPGSSHSKSKWCESKEVLVVCVKDRTISATRACFLHIYAYMRPSIHPSINRSSHPFINPSYIHKYLHEIRIRNTNSRNVLCESYRLCSAHYRVAFVYLVSKFTGLQTGYVPPPQPASGYPDSSQMGGSPYPPVVAAQPQQPVIMVIIASIFV